MVAVCIALGPLPATVEAKTLHVYSVPGMNPSKVTSTDSVNTAGAPSGSWGKQLRVYEVMIPFLSSSAGGSHENVSASGPSTTISKFSGGALGTVSREV